MSRKSTQGEGEQTREEVFSLEARKLQGRVTHKVEGPMTST